MEQLLLILAALALTIAIECGLSLAFRSKRLSYAVLLGNLLTNPALNLALLLYVNLIGSFGYLILLAALELVAIGVEAFAIRLMTEKTWPKAIGLSTLFNAVSFAAGLIILP